MNRAYTSIAIIIMASALPQLSRAQLLKTLMNNVKQNQLMAKTNQSKPSISPADSAAAIKSFMTGTGGSGLLYEFRVSYTFRQKGKDSTSADTLSTAITDGHNIRNDMGMSGMRIQVLGHAGLPRYSILLYPQSKTYVLNIIDTAAINSRNGPGYQVTRIGNETVSGYKCIHSKLTMVTTSQKSGITEDIWTSTDVPGYATLEKLMTVQNVTPKMMQALDQAGCGGFFVKLGMQSSGFSMDMQLIMADRRNFPASMFQIPAGYSPAGKVNLLSKIAR
jgi:hypothetical protein